MTDPKECSEDHTTNGDNDAFKGLLIATKPTVMAPRNAVKLKQP
jgi:hypothetical protein